jgi:S1-C subfamily serine protease
MSFIAKGVPGVQIFTTAHGDYHRPSDTADKIDGPGLVKVATFVKEGVQYLSERPQPLTVTIAKQESPAAPAAAAPAPGGQARRVSFGTVPDFAFPGPGVKVGGLVAGSPAEKAGIKEGDVLMKLAGQDVANLQGFSDILKTLSPGQKIEVVVGRAGGQQTFEVTLAER